VDVGAAGFFKHPGDENFIAPKGRPADRAGPLAVSVKAVGTARDMHKPVGLAHGGKSRGFYPFPPLKPGGTNRAGPGRSGKSFPGGAFLVFPRPGQTAAGAVHRTEKQVIAEPEEKNADDDEYQRLKK
jgi:hypothetical protein